MLSSQVETSRKSRACDCFRNSLRGGPWTWRAAAASRARYKEALFPACRLGGAGSAAGPGVGRFAPAEEQARGPTSNNSFVKNQECSKAPEAVYFPSGWAGEKAAPFPGRDRVLSRRRCGRTKFRGPRGGGRPLPLGNCAPFPAPLSLFSSAPEKDVTAHRPETGINLSYPHPTVVPGDGK